MRQVVTHRTFGIWERPPSAGDLRGAPSPVADNYCDRLIKYTPVETVVVWIAVFGSISAVAYNTEFFPLFARYALIAGAILTWVYLQYVEHVHDGVQLGVATAGFVVWVHALGVLPFAAFPWYNPVAGAIFLPVYTALAPLVDCVPARSPDPAGEE
jgi:hypothetical protein